MNRTHLQKRGNVRNPDHVPGNVSDYYIEGDVSACGNTVYASDPRLTLDPARVTCPPCFTEVVQGRVPGYKAIILREMRCLRQPPLRAHDAHIHVTDGEHVYCPGGVE